MNLPELPAAKPAVPHPPREQSSVTPYAWIILVVVFLLSMAAPLNQFKVPPVMPVLIEALDLTLGSAGLLMSVFAITGFFLALPAGFILQRLGLKTTGLIAAACLVAGSLMGALSAGSSLLLFSRVVEGLGMGLISITAPAAISAWFPAEKRGAPMGIWAAWVPAGSLLMFLLAPALARDGGWQAVWWFGAAFSAAALLLYGIFMRTPPEQTPSDLAIAAPGNAGLSRALLNREIWLLAGVFACFIYAMLTVGTFFPTFLVEQHGYTLAEASRVLSANNAVVLVAAPLIGWLSDRTASRKLFFTVPFLLLIVLVPLVFQIAASLVVVTFIAMGSITGAIPAVVLSAAPEVMENPRFIGMGMAVITMGQNLGMVAGPAAFGFLAEHSTWTIAALSLVPILFVGFILGRLVRIR